MNEIQALALGTLQGVAEFLPISSSGHLIVFRKILGVGEVPLLFDVLLHLATLAAVCLFYRRRLGQLILSLFRFIARRSGEADKGNLRCILAMLVATAATGLLGYFVNKIDLESRPKIVAALFLCTAAILVSTAWLKGKKSLGQIGWFEGLVVGLAQGIGVFPGISRSGITISAAVAAGIKREEAGEFSFILSIPAILGALVLESGEFDSLGGSVPALPLALAMVVAFSMGLISLIVLSRVIKKGGLAWFAIYLVPAGIVGLTLL